MQARKRLCLFKDSTNERFFLNSVFLCSWFAILFLILLGDLSKNKLLL